MAIFKKENKYDIIKIGDLLNVDMILIGNRIREARERKGLTQMKLAELVDLSAIAVFNIESGKSSPNLKNIIQIAKLLEVSIDALVADKSEGLGKAYIHEINLKLNNMNEIGLKHINQYIDLYNETEINKSHYIIPDKQT